MLDISTLQNYLYVSIFVIAIIAFLDVLFRFKRPMVLKVLLLLMIFNVGAFAFGKLYLNYYQYNRLIAEMPTQLLGITTILFFNQLFRNKLNQYVIIFCIVCVILMIGIPIYFHYKYDMNYISVNYYTNPKTSNLISSAKIIISGSIIFFIINILKSIIRMFHQDNIYYISLRKWCLIILIFFVIAFIFILLTNLYPELVYFRFIAHFFAYFLTTLAIIYRPRYFNNMPFEISFLNLFNLKSYSNISADDFSHLFFQKLYFLSEKANLLEFAEQMDVKEDQIVEFVRIKYNLTFIELVNKNRILYVIELLNKPENNHFTLEAISKMSGFGSRQNMHKSFKKYHGGNPSDFINILQNN